MAFNDQAYGLYQGVLFMQRRLMNGVAEGPMYSIGDADKFEITPTQQFDDIKESQTGLRLTSAHNVIGTELKVKINALINSKANFAAALWGTDTGAIAAGTVAAEIVSAWNNGLVPLANIGVSSVVVKLAGTATHVASISVTAPGTGYAPNTRFPMTLTTGVGQSAYAISNAAGNIVGVDVSGTGTALATAASITTPGGGTGATFAIHAGQVPLVLNTDYTLDAINGALTILPGSVLVPAVTDITGVGEPDAGATLLTVAYSYAASAGRVEAFTTGMQYFALRLQGINVANSNQPTIVTCYQVALDMAKMLAFIESKHNSLELDGMLLQDTTRALPTAASPLSQFITVTKA